jgi:hypothetical protein
MLKLRIFLFSFCLITLSSCAEPNISPQATLIEAPEAEMASSASSSNNAITENGLPVDWKNLTASFYSIKYPATWELDTTGLMETSFVLFAPLKLKKDAFRENISLQVQAIDPKKMGMNEYTLLTEQQIIDRLAQSIILKSERSKTGDLECHTLIYTCLNYLKPLKYLRKHWVVGSKAYALSFTCEEPDYGKFEPLVNEIFNSFELKVK